MVSTSSLFHFCFSCATRCAEEGSLAKPKKTPSVAEHAALSKLVGELNATVSGLSAKVETMQKTIGTLEKKLEEKRGGR